MFAFQFKRGKIVVKLCRSPAIRSVTLAAIRSEATFVRLILPMAGRAILQCHGKITEPARIGVTLYTGNADVLTRDFERRGVMVKILSEAVHAIMTIEARRAKGYGMCGHEPYIALAVTGIAGIHGKL